MKSDALSILNEILFQKEQPVTFREFVTGSDYCGTSEMYEFWLKEGMDLDSSIYEVIVKGSLGGGKSWFVAYLIAYRHYLLFFDGNPHKFLGIPSNSPVYFFYFSVSLIQARRSGFKYIYNIIKNCKWFKENCPIEENLTLSIRFSNGFSIEYASAEGHQIGLNVWGFILDEANFRKGVGEGMVEEYEEVTYLYEQLIDRLYSRFSREDGSVAGLAILVSSASYQSSFVEKRENQIKGDKYTKIIQAVAYDIRPEKYSKERFEVFIGFKQYEPCIVEGEKHKQQIIKQLGLEGTDMWQDYFVNPPVSIKKLYLTNINRALQNHSGVATQISGRFLKNLNILINSYYDDEPKIFSQDKITISNGDDVQILDFLIEENIRFPERPHSLFIDLSVAGDSGGLSCFRFDGEWDGIKHHTHVFTLEIVPPAPPYETRISKIRLFIEEFATLVNITAFGSDQFQSKQLRQDILSDLSLQDSRLSIDSTDVFHIQWVRSLVESATRMRYYENLQREVEEAEHDLRKRRVVKRKNSTDDLFQSVVGAYTLSETVSSLEGNIDDLSSVYRKLNVVGEAKAKRLFKKLGYGLK